MKNSDLSCIIAIAFAATLGIAGCESFAYAQNQPGANTASEITGLVEQDENVDASDLGVSKPRILPTNALYAFKDLFRELRTLLAANSLRKAELKLRFADERLIELQSVSAKTKDPNILKPVLEHYQSWISRLRNPIRPDSAEAVNDFLTRLVDHKLAHYKFLGRLEKDVSPEAFGALTHAKEEIIETMMGVPLEFESPESFRKRLEATMASQNGSRFKDFKNLEIIKALQDKAPETARDALRRAEENIMKSFRGLSGEDFRSFVSYAGEIGGNEALHAAVIDDLQRTNLSEDMRQLLAEAQNMVFTRIETRLKQFKDEAQKEEFLSHLEKGTLENILTIGDLERNLAPETRGTILEVKAVAMAEFERTILNADTPKKRESILKETERFVDVSMIAALEEIAKTLPDNDQELLAVMKRRVTQEIEKYPASSRVFDERPSKPEKGGGKESDIWRTLLERALKEAESLKNQQGLLDGAKEPWYQSLLAHTRDALTKDKNASDNEEIYKAFTQLENGMYRLKNTALYRDLRERKTPEFLRIETQRKIALIFLDLKPSVCGRSPSLIAIPLVCKNGRWQRSLPESPQPLKGECRPTGCSGQICADQDIVSACEFKPEYACYKTAHCERQPSGECGWTMTQETRACLERSETAPSL